MRQTFTRNLAAVAVALCGFGGAAQAEAIKVPSAGPVDAAVARLTDAIEASGARVFTTVNFMQGAASVGQTLRPTTGVIFGGPGIGASALPQGQTQALFLPLRILAYEDAEGQTWLMFPDPRDAAAEHGVPADHPGVSNMVDALETMAGIAAGG